MTEKLYGGRVPLTHSNCLYAVTTLTDGAIRIRVCHRNKGLRRVLRNNADNRAFLLDPGRLDEYENSIETAKNRLAQIIKEHRSCFERGCFRFIFA